MREGLFVKTLITNKNGRVFSPLIIEKRHLKSLENLTKTHPSDVIAEEIKFSELPKSLQISFEEYGHWIKVS